VSIYNCFFLDTILFRGHWVQINLEDKMIKRKPIMFVVLLVTWGMALSQEYNPSVARLKVIKLNQKMYKLQCISGTYVNTLALVGRDGILLVDTGYPQTGKILKQELKKLGYGKVRIVVNTHEHNDHIAGNTQFAGEAVIISHERVRRAYGGEYFALKAVNRPGIPSVVFQDRLKIFFNGEEIHLCHFPGGHTLGDIIVHFPKLKIAFVGDMIFADGFPGADISRGGDLNLCLKNVQKIIDEYPRDTTFVNGHGPDYSKKDLIEYLKVGRQSKQRIEQELKKGRGVKEILKSGLMDNWAKWSKGVVSSEDWITGVYQQYLKDTNKFKVSINKPLTEMIVKGDIQKAIQYYKQLRRDALDQYNFAEDQLNLLGYRLLDRNMIKEAIEILKLNVETYPESGNVYDSLAEAYMRDGKRDSAIKYYLISLKKDPSNDNARSMLKKLGHRNKKDAR
jgi:glyoxylase-like metal-dependent hydrolase (beta-lactamase superfamily II)